MLCFKADMRKIMLTVFKHNPEAQKFFRNVMKFETDETNLYDDVYEQVIILKTFVLQIILSYLHIFRNFSLTILKQFLTALMQFLETTPRHPTPLNLEIQSRKLFILSKYFFLFDKMACVCCLFTF